MVYPLCIFGVERCKTLPAGNRPRLQGPILREAALRGLESKREAAHNLASKGYHTLCEHSLVLGDFCFLDVGRFDGFCVLSFRIGDVQNLSSQLRCHFRDSGCLVPDFLPNPHPFFRSALRLTWPLTEASTLSHWRRGILRLSLTAAVRCLFPSDFQRISTKTIIPAMPRKSSRIVYKTQQSAPKLRSNFCEIVRRIAFSRGAVPTAGSSAGPQNLRLGPPEPPATAASTPASNPYQSTEFCSHPPAQAPEPAQIPCHRVQRALPPTFLAAPKHR